MPQLDLFTFLPQIFWLIIFFIIMYLSVVKLVIPNLNRVFKLRHPTAMTTFQTLPLTSSDFLSSESIKANNQINKIENELETSKIMNFFKKLKSFLQSSQALMNKKLDIHTGLQPLYVYYIRENARLLITDGLKLNLYDRTLVGTKNLTFGYTAKLTRRFLTTANKATKRRVKKSTKKKSVK